MATTEVSERPETFEEVVRDRRSVHDYSDDPVDDATLDDLFDLVRYSPSGFNLQPWEFLVLRDDENRQALQECAGGQEHVTDAPAAIVVLGNTDPAAHADRVFDDWLDKGYIPDEETRDGLVEHVEGFRDRSAEENRVWTTRSTALAAMTLMHAARSLGLSTCPMEGFDADAVRNTFDVDDGYEPVMLLTLGYPAEGAADRENDRKFRRPVDEFVHHESFDA
ncbi:nitroreductase family protein [Halomarina ordinaria]|uniref:Nitroreductase family protein n=1 Tax=Halomarina ordinaria TaxID=3033939 RepID=A0ABD5U369_9EURY|nr:nitroreductase family protein [Halomarina sp. PSRA2]